MPNDGENLLPKLKELVPLYEKVKEAILLAEYEGDLKTPLTSINELRNCLDHTMRILSDGQNINSEHEFIEAKAHLYRAANDAYEILVMHKIIALDEFQKQFDRAALKEIFPEYYQLILPIISKAKTQLAKVRSKKPIINEEENTFHIYENIVSQIIQHIDQFQHAASGIIEYEKSMVKKVWKDRILNWVIGGVIVGVLVALITLLF